MLSDSVSKAKLGVRSIILQTGCHLCFQSHTHARTHTHVHTHPHMHTRTRTHAHARTHTPRLRRIHPYSYMLNKHDMQLWESLNSCAVTFTHTHARAQTHTHTRSEEHTSELQSHLNLVCRLLIDKKCERNYASAAR